MLTLATHLARDAHVDSVVVTGQDTELALRLAAEGAPPLAVPWSIGLDPRVLLRARTAMRPGAILHAHDSHAHALADALARMHAAPVVVTRRVIAPIRHPNRYRRASAIIAVSQAVRDVVLRADVPAERVHVIPDAIDVSRLVPAPWPPTIVPPPIGTPLIVCIAALTREKGIDVLIDAAALLHATHPEARWLVLGDGPERGALTKRIAQRGATAVVQLGGFVTTPEAVLRSATLAVQPSHSEGFGSSVLSALALGVPVVASRAGGLVDALAFGGGELVPPGSPVQLAQVVGRLLDNRAERARMSQAGREAAREFDVARMVQRTLDVYRSVTVQPGTS